MRTITILFFFFITVNIYSQSKLELEPDDIEFEDIFNRLENVQLINEGNQDLVIDSIAYNHNFYFLRFDQEMEYPVTIPPGDTIEMDCLLSGYFLITSQDTSDVIKIFHSGNSEEDLEIEIDFFDDDDIYGTLGGIVSDDDGPLQNTKLYFYYDGNYLLDTTLTNSDGKFDKQLPEGNYTIAAEKEGYYFTFYNGQSDPYNATKIFIARETDKEINFKLVKKVQTSNKILGKIVDSRARNRVRNGIVVVRKGKHTPSKLTAEAAELSSKIKSYTAKVNNDGTFTVDDIIEPGYYYIQAFSDFYLPGYTTDSDEPALLWQQTDSTYIQNTVENENIVLKRDSSYGGGIISGSISVSNSVENDSVIFSNIILYAKNIDLNELIYFTIPNNDGNFTINHLPYGKYKLIAQSIGYDDVLSEKIIDISPSDSEIGNVQINFVFTSIKNIIPDKFELFQNYPNPFNPNTIIKYSIPYNPKLGNIFPVQLKVYDILGKEIETLVNKNQIPGNYYIEFNPHNLSSGVYYYQLRVNSFIQTKKMILLR